MSYLPTQTVYNTTPPALTNGQQAQLQGDASGNLRINPAGNTGSYTSKHSAPAAGSDATLTVPAGKKWKFKGGAYVLSPSASVGNRTAGFEVLDGSGNVLCLVFSAFVDTASNVVRYIFAPSLPMASTPTVSQVTSPFPEMVLGPSFVIKSLVSGLLAGDTVVLDINVEEYGD